MVKSPRNANKATATETEVTPVTETESSVYNQPMPTPDAKLEAQAESSNIIGLNRQSNTFETREAWLDAINVALVKFFKENGDLVTPNAMVSIGQPSAKRSKDDKDQVLLKGKVAFTYAPSLSTNKRYQIFIAAQLNHDEDLALALAGQLLRTSVWDDEKDSPNGYSKKAKDLFTKYGLSADISTGSIACLRSSILLPFVMAKVAEFGPSPYAKIDVKVQDLTQRTATRSAKVYCADNKCPCHETTTAKAAKKNKAGGYSFQVSDGWIEDLLLAKNPSKGIEDLYHNDPAKQTANFMPCPFGTATLKYTESEFKKVKRLEKEQGVKNDMK